jgi:hypothetical protein
MDRMQAWMDGMTAFKSYGSPAPVSVRERYERLREQYATGAIELEDFTAGVVSLLREGL